VHHDNADNSNDQSPDCEPPVERAGKTVFDGEESERKNEWGEIRAPGGTKDRVVEEIIQGTDAIDRGRHDCERGEEHHGAMDAWLVALPDSDRDERGVNYNRRQGDQEEVDGIHTPELQFGRIDACRTHGEPPPCDQNDDGKHGPDPPLHPVPFILSADNQQALDGQHQHPQSHDNTVRDDLGADGRGQWPPRVGLSVDVKQPEAQKDEYHEQESGAKVEDAFAFDRRAFLPGADGCCCHCQTLLLFFLLRLSSMASMFGD